MPIDSACSSATARRDRPRSAPRPACRREARPRDIRDGEVEDPRARRDPRRPVLERVGKQPERAQHGLGAGRAAGALELAVWRRGPVPAGPRGSGRRPAASTNANEMRLPSWSRWSSPRMLTGTIAFSGRGCSPRRRASSRRAPATAARQTSLSFTPARLPGREQVRHLRAVADERARGPDRAGSGRRAGPRAACRARRRAPPGAACRSGPPRRARRPCGPTPRAARNGSSAPSSESVERQPRGARRRRGRPIGGAARDRRPASCRTAGAPARPPTCRPPARDGS